MSSQLRDRQPNRLAMSRLLLLAVCLLGNSFLTGNAQSEDRIILRNLQRIKGHEIKSIDVDGVKLDDGRVITWDRIETAQVESVSQEEFDGYMQRLSNPLFRIRLRLVNGDDLEALKYAEQMFPVYQPRDGELSRLVCAALVRGRISAGLREQSVVAYLYYLSKTPQAENEENARPSYELSVDSKSRIFDDLMPVWFDSAAAAKQVPDLIEALRSVKNYPRQFHVYTGSLAIAAGDLENAKKAISALSDSDPVQAELKQLLQAQMEISEKKNAEGIKRLAPLTESAVPNIRALALYWTGVALSNGTNRERLEGALFLLRIPASYGNQFPDLAAAALYQASQAVDFGKDDGQATALRQELLRRYPHSWHGKLLTQTGLGKD